MIGKENNVVRSECSVQGSGEMPVLGNGSEAPVGYVTQHESVLNSEATEFKS